MKEAFITFHFFRCIRDQTDSQTICLDGRRGMTGKITGLRHDCAWCYLSEGRSYGGKGHRSTFHPVHPHWKGVVLSLIQTQQESSLKEFLISPTKISLEHMQRLKQQCISVFYLSFYVLVNCKWGFPSGSEGKASACNAGDPGSIPGSEDLLEKEMATHSSILAWKSPWTEKPGRLQSMGSQRVRHN